MIFRTYSGSTYELDQENKKIRRLYGLKPALERQGQDGEWKEYVDLLPDLPKVGLSVIIVWRYDIQDGQSIARSTQTSLIKEIISEESMS